MPTSPRRSAKKGGIVTKPKAAKVKRYEIKPITWKLRVYQDFVEYESSSGMSVYQMGNDSWWYIAEDQSCKRFRDAIAAMQTADKRFQQQLRRALREVSDA